MRCKGILILLLLLSFKAYSVENRDVLKVGTLYFNPPFEEMDGSKQGNFGFNIAIIKNICAILHKKCQLIPMQFDKLLVALDKHQLDLIIVGITLMPEKPQNYLVSYPYFISEAIFLTLEKSKLHNLNNKTIGIVKNTLFPYAKHYDLVSLENTKAIAHKVDKLTFKYYDRLSSLILGLDNHEVDAIILDAPIAHYWISQNQHKYVQIGPVIRRDVGMSVMTSDNHAQLIEQINRALLIMEKNQTLLAIYREYWGVLSETNKSYGYLVKEDIKKPSFVIPAAFKQ